MDYVQKTINNSHETFNAQADRYDRSIEGSHARKQQNAVLSIVKELPKGPLLDLGCGTGTFLLSIQEDYNHGLYGLDLSEQMLNAARKKINFPVELKQASSSQIPWADTSFATIVCMDSFHHYPEPNKALSECYRTLKQHGYFVMVDIRIPLVFRILLNGLLPLLKTGDFHFYGQIEIEQLLRQTGFENVTYRGIGNSAFMVMAQKIRS